MATRNLTASPYRQSLRALQGDLLQDWTPTMSSLPHGT